MVCQSVSGSVGQSVIGQVGQLVSQVARQPIEDRYHFAHIISFLLPQLLASGQQFPWENAKKPVNKNKNRYANIIPCELTISLLCTDGSFKLYYKPIKGLRS